MKKKQLTVDEHKVIGAELYEIRRRIMKIEDRLWKAIPISHRINTKTAGVRGKIDALRSDLDSLLRDQYPNDFSTKTYYPGDKA
jgi:hypothetical protein